jgi:hypothetical protein
VRRLCRQAKDAETEEVIAVFRPTRAGDADAVLRCVRILRSVQADIERRDCGTGAGGFKPGNKCAGEGGDGGVDSGGGGESGGGGDKSEKQFSPSATVEEAQDWATGAVAKRVDYSGIKDPKMANIANQELSSLVEEYGVKMDFVETTTSLPDGVIAEAGVTYTGRYKDGERVTEVSSRGIQLNENFWESESNYRDSLLLGAADESSHVGGARPRHIMRHEYGHLLDRPEDRSATQEIFNRRKKDLGMISAYATTSREEMFAEGFAMYRQLGSLSNVGGVDFSELEPFYKPRSKRGKR